MSAQNQGQASKYLRYAYGSWNQTYVVLCRWRYLAASALEFIFQQGNICCITVAVHSHLTRATCKMRCFLGSGSTIFLSVLKCHTAFSVHSARIYTELDAVYYSFLCMHCISQGLVLRVELQKWRVLRGSDISANMQEFKIFSSLIWKHCIALANEVIFGVSTYSICFVQWLFSLDSHNTRSAMKIKLPEQLNIGYEIKQSF